MIQGQQTLAHPCHVQLGDAVAAVGAQSAGKVAVTVGDANFEIALSATVYPVEMPSDPTYTAQSWGYFTWQPSKGYEQQAAAELDQARRMKLLRRAEVIMLHDQPIAPIYQYVELNVYDEDRVKNLNPNPWHFRRLELVRVER